MKRFSANDFGHLIPDQNGEWIHHDDVAELERKIAELDAAARDVSNLHERMKHGEVFTMVEAAPIYDALDRALSPIAKEST